MQLNVHIGIMAEEETAKFKPRLHYLDKVNESILVITRESVDASNILFEQNLSRYSKLGLAGTMFAGKHATTKAPWVGGDRDCCQLAYWLSRTLSFNTAHYSFYDVKAKIDNQKPPLTILKIGSGKITDKFIQSLEMGRQSTLFSKEMKRLLCGVMHYIDVKRGVLKPATQSIDPGVAAIMLTAGATTEYIPSEQRITSVYFESFGAGGAINSNILVGTAKTDQITSVLGMRRFLKHGHAHVSKTTLRRFGAAIDGRKPKQSLFIKGTELSEEYRPKDHLSSSLFSQEAARLYLLLLAETMPSLSNDYRRYLLKTNKQYADSHHIAALPFEELVRHELTEADCSEAWVNISRIEDCETTKLCRFILDTYMPIPEARAIIEAELLASKDASISCAASMFIDGKMKVAASKLLGEKGCDANMEDDLIAKLEKYVHNLNHIHPTETRLDISFACFRVHADPFEFPPELANGLDMWAKTVRYTIDQYLDAILWAAYGCNETCLPFSADWPIARRYGGEDKSKYFVHTRCNSGEEIVLDPFWREIGTDFLGNLGSKKLPEEIKDAIKLLLDEIGSTNTSKLGEAGFAELMKTYLKTLLDFCGLIDDSETDKYKVWVRPHKWANGETNTLGEAAVKGLFTHPGNIDRALYVSNNIPALLKAGAIRIEALALQPTPGAGAGVGAIHKGIFQ